MSTIFFLLFLLSFTSSVFSTKDDEIVLLKIKQQLGDPDILQGFNYCNITINASSGNVNTECTNTDRVSILVMEIFNITASFPDAVCGLTELESFIIGGMTGLYGPIPSCITKLFNLQTLIISSKSLSGSVPNFYNHTNISEIHLSGNQLSGTIPSSLSTLPNLTYLDLSSNYLTGTIPPSFSTLPNLSYLDLSSNDLTGTIPPSISTLPNLTYVDLSSNYLTGTIPPSFSTLPNLSYLDLSSNYLTGTIPPDIVHGSSPVLKLSYNNLTGELPKCYGWVDFFEIRLEYNRLSGDASFLLGKQKRTSTLILANNDFEFDLSPVEFSDNLFWFDISHNKIYGKVPESFATAAGLYDVNLSFNRLCGELPQGGNMCRYSALVFENNTCLSGNPWLLCPMAPAPAPALAPVSDLLF